jgi:hypothetical protein
MLNPKVTVSKFYKLMALVLTSAVVVITSGVVYAQSCNLATSSDDCDVDGIPNGVESQLGLNPSDRDNNVFTNARLFAMQQYRDFLGREGDTVGVNVWTARLDSLQTTPSKLAAIFIVSPELSQTTAPIIRLYRVYLGRFADYNGLLFWVNEYRSGRRSLGNVSEEFAVAPEFIARYGTLSDTAFVELVYQNVLGRRADTDGLNYWSGQLLSGAMSRGALMLAFSESPEYKASSAVEIEINLAYFSMLKRPITTAEYSASVSQYQTGGLAEVTKTLIPNAEYRSRFLPACTSGAKITGECIPGPQTKEQTPNNDLTSQSSCFSSGAVDDPCRGYEILKPAACPSGIVRAWQYSARLPAIDMDALGNILNYGAAKLIRIRPNESLSLSFKTPATFTASGQQAGISLDNTSIGAETQKFVTVSESPCDYDLTKIAANDSCAKTGSQAYVALQLGGNARAGYCQLKPNTVYYINLRSEDANESLMTGNRQNACQNPGAGAVGACGFLLNALGGLSPL